MDDIKWNLKDNVHWFTSFETSSSSLKQCKAKCMQQMGCLVFSWRLNQHSQHSLHTNIFYREGDCRIPPEPADQNGHNPTQDPNTAQIYIQPTVTCSQSPPVKVNEQGSTLYTYALQNSYYPEDCAMNYGNLFCYPLWETKHYYGWEWDNGDCFRLDLHTNWDPNTKNDAYLLDRSAPDRASRCHIPH